MRELLWRRRQLDEALALSTEILPQREARFLRASRGAMRMRRIVGVLTVAAVPLVLMLLYVAATCGLARR